MLPPTARAVSLSSLFPAAVAVWGSNGKVVVWGGGAIVVVVWSGKVVVWGGGGKVVVCGATVVVVWGGKVVVWGGVVVKVPAFLQKQHAVASMWYPALSVSSRRVALVQFGSISSYSGHDRPSVLLHEWYPMTVSVHPPLQVQHASFEEMPE